ncbi:MAG: hypothetical protein ACYDCO_23555 [Armatimonadota bacterium]
MIKRVIFLLCCVLLAAMVWADNVAAMSKQTRSHGPSPEVEAQQNTPKVEIYRLRIVNDVDGTITGSRDGGKTWTPVGRVLTFTTKVTNQGYTASKWAPMSAVAATAVNAIHIRTGYNAKDDKGVVFSLLPLEMSTEAVRKNQAKNSFMSPDSSLYTDIPAGTGIFGGDWSPILGNPIALETPAGLQALPVGYAPKQGDVFIISVMQPADTPHAFIFENRFGGFIIEEAWDGSQKVIGQVLKPVQGVGRFSGTAYSAVGRLRANHNGVIDVSTSKMGETGGFQIIPREHAMSPEMVKARTMTQWMVIGPLNALDPSWEGVAPLFRDYLRPSYGADDWSSPDWLRLATSRVQVDVKYADSKEWQPMPSFHIDPDLSKPFPEWANTALEKVTVIRIVLPVPVKGVGE